MANSTLERDYYDLADQIADYLGFPTGLLHLMEKSLTPDQGRQVRILKKLLKSGISQLYFPPSIPGGDGPVDWTFLHPVAEIDFPAGVQNIILPDDFGAAEGSIQIAPSVSLVWYPIPIRNIGMVLQQYAQFPQMVSRPLLAAVSPLKGTQGLVSQRKQLWLFPITDQDYTLQVQYYVLPDMLTGAAPYLWGGAAHSETFKWSCLAAAEIELDNIANGPCKMQFMERLVASISMDRKSRAQNLGANRDLSDVNRRGRGGWWHTSDVIKVNGVIPGA